MKNYIALAAFIVIALTHCKQKNAISLIEGEWRLRAAAKLTQYPNIIFRKDSTAIFTSRIDTVLRFKYHVEDQSLTLSSAPDYAETFKILELSDSLLIFDALPGEAGKQTYLRRVAGGR